MIELSVAHHTIKCSSLEDAAREVAHLYIEGVRDTVRAPQLANADVAEVVARATDIVREHRRRVGVD